MNMRRSCKPLTYKPPYKSHTDLIPVKKTTFGWSGTSRRLLATKWPAVTATDYQKCWWVWRNRWNSWQGGPKLSEKTYPSAALSTTNPTHNLRRSRTRAVAVVSELLAVRCSAHCCFCVLLFSGLVCFCCLLLSALFCFLFCSILYSVISALCSPLFSALVCVLFTSVFALFTQQICCKRESGCANIDAKKLECISPLFQTWRESSH
jgi:hypothetical protein